jgi:hypothetical protein
MGSTPCTNGGDKYIGNFGRETLGKLPFGRLRRWEDNIKINFRQTGYEDGIWR